MSRSIALVPAAMAAAIGLGCLWLRPAHSQRADRIARVRAPAPNIEAALEPVPDTIESSREPETVSQRPKDELKTPSGSPLERHEALLRLASQPDPEGTNVATFQEEARAADTLVAHTALEQLRRYGETNPAEIRRVNQFLLDYARSGADEESRQVAAAAVNFDGLEGGQGAAFATLLGDASEEIRLAAIYSVGRSRRDEMRGEALRQLSMAYLTDLSGRVKSEIVATLGEIAQDDPSGQARSSLASLRGRCAELDPEIDSLLGTESDQ